MISEKEGKKHPETRSPLLRDYLSTLRFLNEVGVTTLPVNDAPTGVTHRGPTPLPPADPNHALKELENSLQGCTRCKLSKGRNHLVFGEGSPQADLMFIGEGPGRDEDRQGRPFVGRAGQLLSRIIRAMGLTRDEVYIANIVKCRPPNNRNPEPDEIAACLPFLLKQIEIIRPRVICALGGVAFQTLMETKAPISRFRGTLYPWRNGIRMIPTFHPAFLLRNPAKKRDVWEDIQKIMAFLGGSAS